MAGKWVDTEVPCRDPECPLMAAPEDDGETRWYACSCGFEFGYEPVRAADDGTCAVGVSAEVRRAFPGPPEPVMLQIGRRPE